MTERDARLAAIRRTIDALDAELLHLLNRRAGAALDVAAVKSREAEPRYYRPEREAALLRRLAEMNRGPLSGVEVVRLFREIVSTCRTLEQRLVIGCTTVPEACAAIGHFGGAVEIEAVADVEQALDALSCARCDHVVIEFAGPGGASPALASLPGRGLALCGEWYARGGRRYVAIGRESPPPTGDDRTSLLVPTRCVPSVECWCEDAGVRMRSTPVAGCASSVVVDVSVHAGEPRLGSLLAECGGVTLGTYPDGGTSPRGS